MPLLNVTCRPPPIEKLFQSMTPRVDVWLIVSDWPPPPIEPLPATNWPPSGKGGAASAGIAHVRPATSGTSIASGRNRTRRIGN